MLTSKEQYQTNMVSSSSQNWSAEDKRIFMNSRETAENSNVD
jgi:hypothetical protein